jgi:hypothetical protein
VTKAVDVSGACPQEDQTTTEFKPSNLAGIDANQWQVVRAFWPGSGREAGQSGNDSPRPLDTADRVALGRCRPRAPTDPYVLALEHTVPQIRDSLRVATHPMSLLSAPVS